MFYFISVSLFSPILANAEHFEDFSSLKCFISMSWINTCVLSSDMQLLLLFTNEQAATNYIISFFLWFIVVCLPHFPDNFRVQQKFYG